MTDLQFDTPENEFGRPPTREQGFDLTGKLVEWGMVGSREQGTYILIGIAALAIVVALYFLGSGGSDAPPLLPQ